MILDGHEEKMLDKAIRQSELEQRFGNLEEMGVYLKGKCPECLSSDFIISPKDTYYCFSCYKGGDL